MNKSQDVIINNVYFGSLKVGYYLNWSNQTLFKKSIIFNRKTSNLIGKNFFFTSVFESEMIVTCKKRKSILLSFEPKNGEKQKSKLQSNQKLDSFGLAWLIWLAC